ncbi:MAG: hypothetical protein KGL95_03520, partial [Patescibacteria group bacterium]|nr:hypothetical protein [Patescibacteria group bacterium]
RIEELLDSKNTYEDEIEKIKKQLGDPEKEKVNVSQFLNLSKNAATVVKMAHVTIQDRICRYIFLNLFVDEEKVASYQAKEPFATLIELRQLRTSRGERT